MDIIPSYLYCNFIGDRQKIYDVRDEGVTAANVKRSGSSEFLAPDKCNFHPDGESVIIIERRLDGPPLVRRKMTAE